MATQARSKEGIGYSRSVVQGAAIIAMLIGSACAATVPQTRSSSPTTTIVPSPSLTLAAGVTALPGGTHRLSVLGASNILTFTVVVPAGWFDLKGYFVDKHPETGKPRPVLALSVWAVGQVFHDPCRWQGSGFDPGPSVENLVAALVAQRTRNATAPTNVTLAGYAGEYLEWSVPAALKSSAWTSFDACDLDSDGVHRDFVSWIGDSGIGDRYEELPGQVDQLWVLNVKGQRLVIDATYSPGTSQSDRAALQQVVASLRFTVP